MFRWFCAVLISVCLSGVASAETRRIALLIGNADYSESVGPLRNPENDVDAVREALLQAGFKNADIRVVKNAKRRDIRREVDAFAERSKGLNSSDLAFFYYSGHGAWKPFARSMSLIPVDARDATSTDFWYDAVNLNDVVIKAFNDAKSQAAWILAIDACRNELKLPTKDLGGGEKAFGVVPSSAGMLVSFAADEGETARDFTGSSRQSPYALALIEELSRPERSISAIFGAVRPNVLRRTGGAQAPVSTNKLNIDITLRVGSDPTPTPSPTLSAPSTPLPSPADPYSVGESFTDCTGCPEMVVIPSGSFTMGSPSSEPVRVDAEGPQRPVRIGYKLAVGKYEVTWAEWEACVSSGGCESNLSKESNWGEKGDAGWGKGSRPVINVSWSDAQAYVKWLSRKTGHTYRLLSEAEWEYAARAGTTTPFSFGSKISTRQANYDGNFTYNGGSQGEYRKKTVAVGSFPANAWGLHDMHGNVREWVEDWYKSGYSHAPSDGRPFTNCSNCSGRVDRGGSWGSGPWSLRSALRNWYSPANRSNLIGFRVARTLP